MKTKRLLIVLFLIAALAMLLSVSALADNKATVIVNGPDGYFTVKGTAQSSYSQSETIGSQITVAYTGDSSKFLFWVNHWTNTVVENDTSKQRDYWNIVSTNPEYTFYVPQNGVDLTAVYESPTDADKAQVIVMGANTQLFSKSTMTQSEEIIFPDTAPNKAGYSFIEWRIADANRNPTDTKATQDNIHTAMSDHNVIFVVPYYEKTSGNTDTITYDPLVEGTVPAVAITRASCSKNGEKYVVSHTLQYYAPDNWRVADSGFLYCKDQAYASEEYLVLGSTNANVRQYKTGLTSNTGTFTLNINTKDRNAVFGMRAYLTCVNGSDTQTYYSDVVKNGYDTLHGHTLTAHEPVAASCTTAGNGAYWSCDVCGKFFSDDNCTVEIEKDSWVISALGHNYVASVTAPTCTEAGYTTHTCSRCGDSYTDTPVSALGHSYTSTVTAPTCTEAGYTTHTCSRCGDSYTDSTTTALGHSYGEPTWSWTGNDTDGYTAATLTLTCTRDGSHTHTENATVTSAAGTGADAGYTVYTATVSFNNQTYTDTKRVEITAVTFTHSDNLAHVDTYLYRVGNGNNVTLGTLFKLAEGSSTPVSNDVTITVVKAESNSSVSASPTYTPNASDWTQSTLKFTGEGPVAVTIKEGSGEPYTLNLEVVTGNNFVENATLNGNANIVLLGNVKVGASSGTNPALTLNGKNLWGNGFEIYASGSNISTMGHGIISLNDATLDNCIIYGPTFTSYVASYNNDNYASLVLTTGGNSTISNCRFSGAQAPLKIKGDAYVSDTILSGGLFCNLYIDTGNVTVENLTTINTQNGLSIVFDKDHSSGSTITINGTLTQHNFVASDTTMNNTYATKLRDEMCSSTYSQYHFTSGGKKYVNPGIISMHAEVGAANIIDNRVNKMNYVGTSVTFYGLNGYAYSITNTDPSLLETSYTEPAYTPSAQLPYPPVFAWSVPSSDNVAAGGDAHCYKDSYGVLQIQFLTGGSKTINASYYATFKKYQGTTAITPSSITCTKDIDGTTVTPSGTSFTFTEAGDYTITYQYNNVSVYDKDLGTTTTVNYTQTLKVNVAVKKVAPNAVITVTQTNGTMIWGGAGSSFDRDYQPAAQIFDYMTITDYDDDGNPYTVLDGSNQSAFLNNIASVVADSDNKTGFTINFPDGTKLVIKCGAPYNSGTLQFKKYNNKFLMCGSVAYNNPTAATWNVTSYTYTGRNGVAVTYGKRGFTSTTDSTYYSLSNLSSNKFLMFDAQGGTVSPSYTGTSPATLPTPTREGYTFQNWNTKADGTGTARNAGTSMTFSSSTTLYAIWAKDVTVSFSSEGSVVGTISAGAGTTNTLPSPTSSSSWLEGWYTAETGGTKIGNAGASFTVPNSDTTYYAHWSPKYAVSYNANGGTVGTASATYEGTALTLPTPTNGTKTFEGWFTAAEGGSLIGAEGDSYVPTANIELFAHWSDNIKVTFDANGGSAGTNSATYDPSTGTPITLPTATWAGHAFNGWYTAASGGTKVGNAGASYTPSEPTTLYAQWTAYTVTYDANGGNVSPSSASAGSNGSVTLPTPTRTGYTFNGWYTATSGGTKIGDGGASYTPTADITLHAQWTQQKFTVTISAGSNGSVSPTSVANVPYGTTITVNSNTLTINGTTVTATANSNYSFDKWSVSSGATVTSAMTITASFKSSGGSSCVPSGTMVTMADGTQKPIEDVTVNDRVLVFNHETGAFDTAGIIFFEADGVQDWQIINLNFSDGSSTRLIYEHGYFDLDLMKYVYFTEDNYTEFIGHRFAKATENGGIRPVVLVNAFMSMEHTGCYSFPSMYHLNFIADDLLSMPGGITGMFNIFDYDVTLKYDEEAMAADIETYGLLDYSFFADWMTYEEYSMYPAPYLGVALGKGVMTPEQLEYLIGRYVIDKR